MHERIKNFLELVHNLYTAWCVQIYTWFLLNFTFWRQTNLVSSWVSVRDRSHVQFGTNTVCVMTMNCCTAKGDVTRRMCMEHYQNVAQYCGAYRPNSIPTNFQKYPINTAIHSLCYRHKHTQITQKQDPIKFCFTNTNILVADIYRYRPVQTVSNRTDRW